ncbi:MAG: leucine-rich repeat protein, partial [Ruminiclostridium sp.]|nr:leucine-rich repeat protein [Ruminiclostridium sp.]
MKKLSMRIMSAVMAVAMIFTTFVTPDVAGIDFGGFAVTKTTTVKKTDITGSTSNPVGIVPSDSELIYGDEDGITKAEWMHNLAIVFDMYIEEDNCPDNYFTDIDSSYEYYYDIMLAIEFGVMDIPYGEAFEPEEIVTRQLAATTLNFCLGFEFDSEENDYTFSESTDEAYADCIDDFQIAVERGWFALSDGKFLPDSAVTSDEAEEMLTDAAAVVETCVVDETVENKYVFADYVIDYTEATTIRFTDNDTVVINNTSIELSVGDTFVVWRDGFPFVHTASSIVSGNGYIVVDVTDPPEDAIEQVLSSGTFSADLSNFEPEEDVELIYIENEQQAAAYAAKSGETVYIGSIIAKRPINLANGLKVDVECNLKNLQIEHYIKWNNPFSINWGFVKLTGDTELKAQLTASAKTPSTTTLTLGTVNYGPVSASLKVVVSLSGKIIAVYLGSFSVGVEYNGRNLRAFSDFRKKQFTLTAEVDAKLGLKLSANVNIADVIKGEVYAETGIQAKLSMKVYGDNTSPTHCEDLAAWLYAKAGVSASAFGKKVNKDIDIFNRSNSPFYLHLHFDEGKQVKKCMKGVNTGGTIVNDDAKYTSPSDSKLGTRYQANVSSAWVGGSIPSVAEEPVILWDYTLDEENKATITEYNGYVGSLAIPEQIDGYDVVAIGDSVFQNNKYLRMVVIPDGVTKIGNRAFYGCTNLSSVTIPDTVTEIGAYAFSDCTSLSSVTMSKYLTTIYYGAFRNCTKLTSIFIPKSLETVYYNNPGVFQNSGLKNVTFENGIKKIPDYLFSEACNLQTITIPDTITEIGSQAFYNCTGLTSVTIPDSVVSIGDYAFKGCTSLPDITLPDTVTEIGAYAFSDCTNLSSVTMSKSLTTLWYGAFRNCTKLTSIFIPKSLTTVYHNNPGVFQGSGLNTITFESGIKKIPDYLFSDAYNLKLITIPDTITEIGSQAFYNCTGLTSVTIPDSVVSIGDYAFKGCTSLPDITIPDGITEIGGYAFYQCTSFTEITIPDSVTTLGYDAFRECTSLKKVKLSEGLTEINEWMFYGCTALEEVNIPKKATHIYNYTFYNCSSLKSITLPETLTYIGACVFQNCDTLTTVTIPDSVENINTQTFYDCDALTTVIIGNGVKTIGSEVFYDCDMLSNVTIGEGCTTIYSSAFRLCPALTEIVLPKNLVTISDSAFAECTKLAKATIYSNVTSIADKAFSYPAKMTIYGYTGSYAEEYATGKDITFSALTKITGDKLAAQFKNSAGKYVADLDYGYTCGEIQPQFILLDGNYVLKSGTDYEIVSYNNNINVGTGSITIKLLAPMYTGSKTVNFDIVKSDISVATYGNGYDANGTYQYNKLWINGNMLTENTDYTLANIYDLNSGATKIVAKGMGNFYGEAVVKQTESKPLFSIDYSDYYNAGKLDGNDGLVDAANDATWNLDFSILDSSVWEAVDKITAKLYYYSDGIGGIGVINKEGKWMQAVPESSQRYTSYVTLDNIGGLLTETITDPETGEKTSPLMHYQFWWITSDAQLISITMYDSEGNVLVSFPDNIPGVTSTVEATIKNGEITISNAVLGSSATDVVIPEYININGSQYPVTAIASSAFKNCTTMKSITLPTSITTIGTGAFTGCTALKDVYFDATQEAWDAITINSGNTYLTRATLHLHEHDYIEDVWWSPTCEDTGYSEFTCRCGDYYGKETPALGHDYTKTVVPPTPTSEGYTIYYCNRCELEFEDDFVDPIPFAVTAVEGFKSTSKSTTAIRLSWTKNDTATGYIIEQYVGSNWVQIADITDNTVTEYKVTGLVPGTAYKFRMKAYATADGETIYGEKTATLTVNTLMTAVKDFASISKST